jgi:FAD dependent oxidoreductase
VTHSRKPGALIPHALTELNLAEVTKPAAEPAHEIRADGYVWEMFGPDHVHYVPLRAMTPPGAHNLVAAGRCVDGDAAALSSVRVMGPCAAMGAGAAHALDLAGRGSVHEVDLDRLRDRLIANVSG